MIRRRCYKELVIDDSSYELTPEYRAGALAFHEGVPWNDNPHREDSYRHDQWIAGHTHEDEEGHALYAAVSSPTKET